MNNLLICFIGESGSGKSTIVDELEKRFGYTSIQSYTTRQPRYENEKGHVFINDVAFNMLRNDLVAYTLFNGFEYGATWQQVEANDLYVVDYRGYSELLEKYKGFKYIISIYVDASEDERRKRMLHRGDSKEKVNERIEHDKIAFLGVKEKCDYVVENNNINKVIDKIVDIIYKESAND